MEKRRAAVRRLLGLGLVAAWACASAQACKPALDGTTLESKRYVLSFRSDKVAVGSHFNIEISVRKKNGSPEVESLSVNASMPEHGHGMNYAPTVKKTGPGRWRAEGLMFHMQGKWELVFELRAEDITDVLRSSFVLSESSTLAFTDEERRKILSHGPWPPKRVADPSNRVSGRLEAIALGERLFYEPRLSGTGSVLCATCHVPFRAFQDGRARGFGLEEGERNTPTLFNVRFERWFGWDGANDSLWAQSVRPLLDPREMRSSASHVAAFVRGDPWFSRGYAKSFGRAAKDDADEAVLVNVGKALAAFQETLVSSRTPFDDFRDALERGDAKAMAAYPLAAQRGLRIFVGEGRCNLCHFGPRFTNGEFADTGVVFFVAKNKVDQGRYGGIRKLKENPLNLLGEFNDDRSRSSATGTSHVELQHRNFGEFRVPGLRNVANTGPYMHNGSIATLRDVVLFYSNLDEERLHADGTNILRPLRLSDEQVSDLTAFLESLSPGPRAAPH
jgi:cytochrome c peroxidase